MQVFLLYGLDGIMLSKNAYSKYEKTRILAARSLQISQGAHPMVKVPPGIHQIP